MSDTAELTDINGIGPATAEALDDAGIKTVEDLSNESPEDVLGALEDFPVDEVDVNNFKAEASDLVYVEEEDGEEDEAEPKPEMSLTMDGTTYRLALHAISEFSIQAQQRSDLEDTNRATRFFDLLIEEGPVDPEKSVMLTFEADMDDLNVLNRAFSAGVSDIRRRSGTVDGWAELDALLDDVGDLRSEHWGQ